MECDRAEIIINRAVKILESPFIRRWLTKKQCNHYFPHYLHGATIVGRFPYQEQAFEYEECLHCRHRQRRGRHIKH